MVRIFEEYAAGKIGRDIIDGLTADGILARDGKPFGRCAIYGILQNERYSGVYRHPRDGVFYNTFPRIVPEALFETVRKIAEENKLGGNRNEEPYLLRGKLRCGYCGAKMRGDSGTSQTGRVARYYSCGQRKTSRTNKCQKQSIRKDDLEKLVIDITLKVLDDPSNLEKLVDKIFEMNDARTKTNSTLAILYSELNEVTKSIDNLMKAIEQGIVTSTTKERLQELEGRRDELKGRIKVEDSKARIKLTKPEILRFIGKAIRKEPAQMIRLLIKEIVVYDDKIEVYYNTSERTRPDGEDTHQAFCFYTETFCYENLAWWFTMKGGSITNIEVSLLI